MTLALIAGLALMALAVASFLYSLPRGGKTARFVGTEWEGYAVTTMIGSVGIGLMLCLVGVAALVR
jgi:ABC-type proline/glycine betaine transport system substrate-binding protein